jgi:hypothetical protein
MNYIDTQPREHPFVKAELRKNAAAFRAGAERLATLVATTVGPRPEVTAIDAPRDTARCQRPRTSGPSPGLPGLSHGFRFSSMKSSRTAGLTPTGSWNGPRPSPRKFHGLYPKRDTIAIGADADLAVWDPERRQDCQRRGGVRPPRLFGLRGPEGEGLAGDGPPPRRGDRGGREALRRTGQRSFSCAQRRLGC